MRNRHSQHLYLKTFNTKMDLNNLVDMSHRNLHIPIWLKPALRHISCILQAIVIHLMNPDLDGQKRQVNRLQQLWMKMEENDLWKHSSGERQKPHVVYHEKVNKILRPAPSNQLWNIQFQTTRQPINCFIFIYVVRLSMSRDECKQFLVSFSLIFGVSHGIMRKIFCF